MKKKEIQESYSFRNRQAAQHGLEPLSESITCNPQFGRSSPGVALTLHKSNFSLSASVAADLRFAHRFHVHVHREPDMLCRRMA
jgi:hypothetical protein